MINADKITVDLIAPCGMDCGICKAHLRKNHPCHGCHFADQNQPKTRVNCKIRNCQERRGRTCDECDQFPCERLRTLDQRYRTKYEYSEIANLEFIHEHGIDEFVKSERKKWLSDRGVLCVHDRKYY